MIEFNERNGCINVYSGIEFDFQNPTTGMIDINDIARGLAYKPHFGGHSPKFFSIAQHSILVVNMLPYNWIENESDMVLAALLHDAAEAYIGDMIKPIKELLPVFQEIENKIIKVIFKKFDLDIDCLPVIKEYDIKAQEFEFKAFYKGARYVGYLTPDEALSEFLDYFKFHENRRRKIS